MIDWVDCTTVMIGRPSPKIFPSILNICVPCRCVSRSEAHGWVKDTCALSKGARDQMQAQSSRLGRERINATLGGQHFGEPQGNRNGGFSGVCRSEAAGDTHSVRGELA